MEGVNGMAHRMWTPNVGGTHHTVVARWNPWIVAGELIIDGAVVKTWGGTRLARPDIKFQIEGHDAFLRNTLTAFDLFVDGGKVPYKLTVP